MISFSQISILIACLIPYRGDEKGDIDYPSYKHNEYDGSLMVAVIV